MRWEYVKAVFSEFVDGVLLVGAELLSAAEKSAASGRGFEPIQPLGLRARPQDPDVDSENNPTTGAGLLLAWDGDEGHAMPVGDPRALEQMPQGQKGSAYLYACTAERKPSYIGIEGDGSHQYLAQYPDGSASHVITLEVHSAGNENIQIRHGDGHSAMLLPGGKVVLSNRNGDVFVEINDDEIVQSGPIKANGGMLVGDVISGQQVALVTDLDALKTAIIATIAGLVSTAPGSAVSSTVPLIASTPGSSKLKASP